MDANINCCFFLYFFIGTSPAEEKKEFEEKKMTLFRKLSFRPTVEELKARKVKDLKGKHWNFFRWFFLLIEFISLLDHTI